MRVLYDSEGFLERFGGVSQSFVKLITHFPPGVEPVLAVERTCNLALQRAPFDIPSYPDRRGAFLKDWNFRGKWRLWQLAQRLFPNVWPDDEMANRRCLASHIARGDFDVLHLTGAHVYGDVWKKAVGRKPIVVTVHDLIPEILQGNRRIATLRRDVLAVASHVIAVSENTKRDLMRLYGVPDAKITVIHHGCGDRIGSAGAKEPYLLYVGKREGYKNWMWFVEQVSPLLRAHGSSSARSPLRLVCTGRPFAFAERRHLKKLGIESRVEQRFALSDEELANLYRRAMVFVYPSRYEGFGLPILDAFAAGCPVLLSRSSCFPEIAGDAACYFDPTDGDDLRRQLERILSDDVLCDGLIRRGQRRLAAFDWTSSAHRLADVYESVLKREAANAGVRS